MWEFESRLGTWFSVFELAQRSLQLGGSGGFLNASKSRVLYRGFCIKCLRRPGSKTIALPGGGLAATALVPSRPRLSAGAGELNTGVYNLAERNPVLVRVEML